jgi:hypothetical protein
MSSTHLRRVVSRRTTFPANRLIILDREERPNHPTVALRIQRVKIWPRRIEKKNHQRDFAFGT